MFDLVDMLVDDVKKDKAKEIAREMLRAEEPINRIAQYTKLSREVILELQMELEPIPV